MATYTGQSPAASQYGMFAAQAQQALQQATARVQQQRGQFLQQSGLEGIYGADGKMTDFKVSAGPGSEFGGYQQMTKGMADQGAQNDAAFGSLGFKGGVVNQDRNAAAQQDAATSSAWGQNTLSGLSDLSNQDQQNNESYNSSLFSQFQSQVQQAIANGTFNPADYSGINIPGYGNPYQGTGGGASGGGGGQWKPPVVGRTPGGGKGGTSKQSQNYVRWVQMGRPGGTYQNYVSNHQSR